MPITEAFLWTFIGVLVSFALPPLLRAAGVAGATDPTANVQAYWPKLQAILTSRYMAITVLSLLLALVVVAVLADQMSTWSIAFLSGLGWQSILARTLAPGT